MRMKDVRVERDEGLSFPNIHIKGSKTDQYNLWDQKRLEEVGGPLRPVAAIASYLTAIDRNPNSSQPLFGKDIRARLTSIMKLAATTNHANADRIGTHSLRSGGANTMFVAGYDAEIIKKAGATAV